MNGHIIFQNSIRILTMLCIMHDVESFKCYSCQSGEWERTAECESPTMSTTKADDCEECYTIYRKDVVSDSDTVLVRACFSKEAFMKSKYSNLKHYIVQRCSDNLCNGETFNSHTLETLQGMDDSSNFELAERIPKTCYKCSSYNDKDCKDVNKEETLTATDCQNKLCTTIYSKNHKAVLRDCFSWKKIHHLVIKGPYDWIVDWCSIQNCNRRSLKNVLHCGQGPAGKRFSGKGCVELGRKTLDSQEKQATRAQMKTTAAVTSAGATTTKSPTTTVADTASKLRPGNPDLIHFMLIMLAKLFLC